MADQNDSLPIVPLMIGGKATAANPPLRFPIYSYEQQKNVGLAESADVATAKLAADTAAEAFKTWKKVSAVKRRELLLKYSALLRAHKEDLSVAQAAETSAPKLWCYKNVDLACSLIEETAACITSLKGDIVQTESTDALALALTVPIGPVLVIAP
jgi:acyl-CoA reductase-like NAD-dependent aldehyde dehydrogenase